ncbi:IMPACT family protein [Calorimonas adulescens]|jgi:Domain of unknown function (DUF1949)./Uncharacterized protein family UPF0029.|uniref:DUF1949 domain-containing protein n=1 Tax=Calorimonas adulescens TaxID=2606906 RepID=A0A5D8QFW1_9THEO|nr:YigZ family protein [Calorimonas adulescens]TZE83590.1 DUF1949 domain-containing protein [Calorimonas adulescens]
MELEPYVSILKRGESEFIEKKSHFLGHALRVSVEDEAFGFIEEIRDFFKDATHNVYAYKLKNGIMRYSDDGEPSGTAGLPVLDVINNMGIVDVVVVVTRYFGGILLGRGGLARAYSRAARDSLIQGQIVTYTPFYVVSLTFDYPVLGKLDNYLMGKVHVIDKIYTDRIEYKLYLRKGTEDAVFSDTVDITSGRCIIDIQGETYLPVSEGKLII